MPHVCGDEPLYWLLNKEKESVCPTYVGMNRASTVSPYLLIAYAPRMWG